MQKQQSPGTARQADDCGVERKDMEKVIEVAQAFLAVCGGISIVGGAAAVIHKWVSPAVKLSKRVETLEIHDKRDYEALQEIRERDSLIMETLITMLNSQISGTNEEQLKKTRDKLISYLAQQKQ